MEMYSVYDRKLREYGNVLLAANFAALSRTLQMGLRGTGSLMETYPDDFEVMLLGTFDVGTGEIVIDGRPKVVGSLAQIVLNGKVAGNGVG